MQTGMEVVAECNYEQADDLDGDWASLITTVVTLDPPGLGMLLHIEKPPPHCDSWQDYGD